MSRQMTAVGEASIRTTLKVPVFGRVSVAKQRYPFNFSEEVGNGAP
jgi:hypothetical protein